MYMVKKARKSTPNVTKCVLVMGNSKIKSNTIQVLNSTKDYQFLNLWRLQTGHKDEYRVVSPD
jgi:hypothetical protein